MKKRLLALSCLLFTMFPVLSGCSYSGNIFNSGDIQAEDIDIRDLSNKKVGVLIYQLSDDFMSRFCSETVKYMESLGFSSENIISV